MNFIQTLEGEYINAALVKKFYVAPSYGIYGGDMPSEKFFVYADSEPLVYCESYLVAHNYLKQLIAELKGERQ